MATSMQTTTSKLGAIDIIASVRQVQDTNRNYETFLDLLGFLRKYRYSYGNGSSVSAMTNKRAESFKLF
jgi:hypothetical protein